MTARANAETKAPDRERIKAAARELARQAPPLSDEGKACLRSLLMKGA